MRSRQELEGVAGICLCVVHNIYTCLWPGCVGVALGMEMFMYLYVNGATQNASNNRRSPGIRINSFARLDKFFTETLARPLSDYRPDEE